MQVMIGSVRAFSDKCVLGLEVNRAKTNAWLAKNAIVVTALNPLIGYEDGAAMVKDALTRELTVGEVAREKAAAGELKHRDEGRPVTVDEIEIAFRDLRNLTEGGIVG
jgi:fumarate hydratase class II